MLGNLSPRLRSQLKSMQLLAVAKSSVVDKYGVKTPGTLYARFEEVPFNSILHMHTVH